MKTSPMYMMSVSVPVATRLRDPGVSNGTASNKSKIDVQSPVVHLCRLSSLLARDSLGSWTSLRCAGLGDSSRTELTQHYATNPNQDGATFTTCADVRPGGPMYSSTHVVLAVLLYRMFEHDPPQDLDWTKKYAFRQYLSIVRIEFMSRLASLWVIARVRVPRKLRLARSVSISQHLPWNPSQFSPVPTW